MTLACSLPKRRVNSYVPLPITLSLRAAAKRIHIRRRDPNRQAASRPQSRRRVPQTRAPAAEEEPTGLTAEELLAQAASQRRLNVAQEQEIEVRGTRGRDGSEAVHGVRGLRERDSQRDWRTKY